MDMDPKQLEQMVVRVLQNDHPWYPHHRNMITCFRCGEQGHIRTSCLTPDMFCTHCRTPNHSTKACRRYNNNNNSAPNSNSEQGYHPTPSPTQTDTNGLFAPAKTSTAVQSPIPNTTVHPDTANITTAMTQAVQQGVSKAIGKGDVSKQMLKNLERFDGKESLNV